MTVLGIKLFPIFTFGNEIDSEEDGQPTLGADGDDINGSDDEDGVEFTSKIISGHTATITVNASASGYLNAWIDWERDGEWDKKIVFSKENCSPLETTNSHLKFQRGHHTVFLPMPGSVFSSTENLGAYGEAQDGEVRRLQG